MTLEIARPLPQLKCLGRDLNTAPESDITLNLFGFFFGLRIVPSGIFIFLPIDHQGVIAGFPLPGAVGVSVAVLKIFSINGLWRKIVIAFNDLTAIAFGEDDTIPDCFGHIKKL